MTPSPFKKLFPERTKQQATTPYFGLIESLAGDKIVELAKEYLATVIDQLIAELQPAQQAKFDALKKEFERQGEEQLTELRKNIEQFKGDKGDNYTLTDADKSAIAAKITVPIIEKKIIERRTEVVREQPMVTEVVKEIAKTDTPDQIVAKIAKADSKIPQSSIEGLGETLTEIKRVTRERKGGGGKGGGGLGNVQHEVKSTSSATTSVSTAYKIGGGGYALWTYYNGALLSRGVQYTVGTDMKTLTFTFTLDDNSTVDIIYHRT